jgi:hypothetical protein
MKNLLQVLFCVLLSIQIVSCSSTKQNFAPNKKYSAAALQQDYQVLRQVLEKKHPSLYWYTSKEKLDAYFNRYQPQGDSLTEQQFLWLCVTPLLNKIKCGHTAAAASKAYAGWAKNKAFSSFPYYVKIMNDSLVAYASLLKKDSIIKRGTVITSINNIKAATILKYMQEFISTDGYAINVALHKLSANFPYYHRNIFGLNKKYDITYLDSLGRENKTNVAAFSLQLDTSKKPKVDSIVKVPKPKKEKISRKARLKNIRDFVIDSSKQFATLTVNGFNGGGLRKFFRKSFKQMRKQQIANIIIDVRTNPGGKVALSTLLTKYITNKPFKIADTCFANVNTLGKQGKYFKKRFFYNFSLLFSAKRKADDKYHIKQLEKHYYKPKQNNFTGNVYVLASGPTFSAATLFCAAVKGQQNVTIVGEETGGGWYGNSGVIIPKFTLPNTKLQVYMPMYRIVLPNVGQPKGSGVIPDVLVPPSYDALINGYDKKMRVAIDLIKKK